VTGTVETDLVLSRRHGGSDTSYASFYDRVKEFQLLETIWRENIPQSVAVTSSGTVWGNTIIRAPFLQNRDVLPRLDFSE